ncbi:hypothetical protein BS47DRAFT_1374117 [Hydnum rufescens UP504]|uniref:MFS general substrate transporter n=1 Tax=Hydnum rufescens UP504 TaxID=1448309 RepID=A0A9P6AIN6_9AGAM|nr:hypothetical protein BS47DRAFT_1374117 [Hydnum rufescens UP504]
MSDDVKQYSGSGTFGDPFVPYDRGNPKGWSRLRKWAMTLQLGLCTLCVSIASSAYSGSLESAMRDLHMSRTSVAPQRSSYPQRLIFLASYTPFTLFHIGGTLAPNVPTLLATRFLAGACGSSPLSNAGGVIQDIWDPDERGLPQNVGPDRLHRSFFYMPGPGPVFGPIIGGYVSQVPRLGWRWVLWVIFIFSASNLFMACIYFPETYYAPILFKRRARELQAESGGTVYYVSKFSKAGDLQFAKFMKKNLSRPFIYLFTEPIVLLLGLYFAIVYSILHAFFEAFPVVFQQGHHFSPGEGGLAFLGVGLGVAIGGSLSPLQAKFYREHVVKNGGPQPEARLILARWADVALPTGMFWFAWTSSPSVHWIVPILAGVPFGASMAILFTAIIGYLIDTYTIYCASALAANVLLRSILATVFPLFTPSLLAAVGPQWGSTIFACLALICTPIPFLFYVRDSRVPVVYHHYHHDPHHLDSNTSKIQVGHLTRNFTPNLRPSIHPFLNPFAARPWNRERELAGSCSPLTLGTAKAASKRTRN